MNNPKFGIRPKDFTKVDKEGKCALLSYPGPSESRTQTRVLPLNEVTT